MVSFVGLASLVQVKKHFLMTGKCLKTLIIIDYNMDGTASENYDYEETPMIAKPRAVSETHWHSASVDGPMPSRKIGDTKKYEACIGALHKKATSSGELGEAGRDGIINRLSEKTRAQITREDLEKVTSTEYACSRIYRLRNEPDRCFRILSIPYYVFEYHLMRTLK